MTNTNKKHVEEKRPTPPAPASQGRNAGTNFFGGLTSCSGVMRRVKVESMLIGLASSVLVHSPAHSVSPPRIPHAECLETCPAGLLAPSQRHLPRTKRSSPAPSLPGGRICR